MFVADGGARGQTRKSRLAATARGCELKLVKMQTGELLVYALATLAVVNSSAWAAPATPSTKLDEQGFWKAWLLYEEPAQPPEEGGRRKGQIQPKSIFIAPVIKDLPDCAPGYQADALGRCNKLVKVNQNAQLGFLLQKLNAMYASPDKLSAPRRPTTTEGPLQLSIPIAEAPEPVNVNRTTTTTAAPTTTTTEAEEATEVAEMMVVAAQVELQDENKSTNLPGAIVTLWHLNETTTTPPEITETETEVPTEMTTLSIDAIETTPPPPTEVDTQPAETTTEELDTTIITTMSPLLEEFTVTTPKASTMRPIHVVEQIISKPSEPDQVIEAEFYPEVVESERKDLEPQTQTQFPQEPTSPVDIHRPYPDPVMYERPAEVEVTDLTGDNSNPPLQWGRPSAKLEQQTVPSTDRIVFPQERLRNEGGSPSTASTTPWSWGTWQGRTTPRPLLLNFYSHLPQLSHNQGSSGGVRTHLSHPSVYPAPGRHTPLFYQELTGHDVANVLGRPWRHHRNY